MRSFSLWLCSKDQCSVMRREECPVLSCPVTTTVAGECCPSCAGKHLLCNLFSLFIYSLTRHLLFEAEGWRNATPAMKKSSKKRRRSVPPPPVVLPQSFIRNACVLSTLNIPLEIYCWLRTRRVLTLLSRNHPSMHSSTNSKHQLWNKSQ